jgi:2-dehydropantoate 2-reductase
VPQLETLRDAGNRAGFEAVLSDNIMVDIWAKFARLTVFSGMTAVARVPLGIVVTDPGLVAMAEAALHGRSPSRGRRFRCPPRRSTIMASYRALPPGVKSSMLEDLERGRRLEPPWLSGAVVRIGEDGVPTPTHRSSSPCCGPVNGRLA